MLRQSRSISNDEIDVVTYPFLALIAGAEVEIL